MTESQQFQVIALNSLYGEMHQPISTGADKKSMSILWPRRRVPISPPSVQMNKKPYTTASDFEFSEVAATYLPEAIVTKTGAVIVDKKYVIQETLEGSLEANGIGQNASALINEATESSQIIIGCNRLGIWNYSLFLLEVAPSLLLSSLLPELNAFRIPMFFAPFMTKIDIENRYMLLEAMGVARERVFESTEQFTKYSGVVVFKVNDPHKSQRLSQMLSMVTSCLRHKLSTSSKTFPRRLYISRQRASSRRLQNFEELKMNVLKKHDIEAVELELFDLRSQVDMFSKADLVVAEHGAGLANIAFMRPGSFVIELLPEPISSRAVYRYIANDCHLNYLHATFPVKSDWRWDKDDVAVPIELYDSLISHA